MIICERCGTENLNGSRYCDECGAALWLAGKSGGLSLPGSKNNGSDGNAAKDAAAYGRTINREGKFALDIRAANFSATGSVRQPCARHARNRTWQLRGQAFPLSNQDANIGRWDADGVSFLMSIWILTTPKPRCSRRHARISLRDGQYVIEDLGSTNGDFCKTAGVVWLPATVNP